MGKGGYPVSLACECGSALKLSPGEDLAKDGAVAAVWLGQHSGKGHGRCSVAEASVVRHQYRKGQGAWVRGVGRKVV